MSTEQKSDATSRSEKILQDEAARKEYAERIEQTRRNAEIISKSLEGREHSDSGELQHEDRQR
ncbi:MAG: hypothetical protein ACRD9R_13885 [Pyrinomonadaceae bacterium]